MIKNEEITKFIDCQGYETAKKYFIGNLAHLHKKREFLKELEKKNGEGSAIYTALKIDINSDERFLFNFPFEVDLNETTSITEEQFILLSVILIEVNKNLIEEYKIKVDKIINGRIDKEINDFIKLHGIEKTINYISKLADLHIHKKDLKELEYFIKRKLREEEAGNIEYYSKERHKKVYELLKNYVNFLEDEYFIGKGDKRKLTEKELEDIQNTSEFASDELVEEYRKRVDEIIKEMKE